MKITKEYDVSKNIHVVHLNISDDPDLLAMQKAEMALEWCECENDGDTLFHENHVTPFNNCVVKHHYHCGRCLGLTQIG